MEKILEKLNICDKSVCGKCGIHIEDKVEYLDHILFHISTDELIIALEDSGVEDDQLGITGSPIHQNTSRASTPSSSKTMSSEEQTVDHPDSEEAENNILPAQAIKEENEENKKVNNNGKKNGNENGGKCEEEEPTTGDSGVSSPGEQKSETNLGQLVVKKKEPEDSPESPPPPDSPDGEEEEGEEITPDNNIESSGEKDDDEKEKEMKPTLGGITVRKPAELLASPGGSFSNMAALVSPKGVANGEYSQVDNIYTCSVCLKRFSSGPELENHMSVASHYVCSLNGSECASIGFSSAAELAAHQAQAHQGPVQQLAQQVERLPASYSVGHQGYQNQQLSPSVQMYPSYQNARTSHLPLGAQVMLTPVGQSQIQQPSPSIPNLPGIQVTKRTAPAPIETTSQPKQRREETVSSPSIRLPDSITLVKPSSMASSSQPASKKDTVADLLATRGITVLPSSGAARSAQPAPQSPARRLPASTSQLNSSVSITPSSRQIDLIDLTEGDGEEPTFQSEPEIPTQEIPPSDLEITNILQNVYCIHPCYIPPFQVPPLLYTYQPRPDTSQFYHPFAYSYPNYSQPLQTLSYQIIPPNNVPFNVPNNPTHPYPAFDLNLNNQKFVVPRGRQLPTVDLTQDADNPRRRMVQRRLACQICDKVFPTPEALNAHVNTHRTQSKLPYECELCTAQYPTEQGLANHRLKFHGRRPQVSSTSMDMALPVVDIRQPGVKEKLLQVGVRHVLMLSQLHNRSGTASFGLPIVPVDLANNQAFCSLGDMGVSNLLPLGALQSLR